MTSILDRAIEYANDVLEGKEITTPEVKKECEWFFRDLEKSKEEDYPYYFDVDKLGVVEKLTMLMNFATGIGVVGQTIYDGLVGFQCFFLVNIFGWRYKSNSNKFRYRTVTMFIPRKNAKTFLCAVILIILMITEPRYSEFYSICVDRELAGIIKKAMTQIIEVSPYLAKHFTISKQLSGRILCKVTDCYYQARTAESSKNNSIMPTAFVADEIGAFTSNKNINAMKSGQKNVENKIAFQLTTAYAEDNSIMLEELDYLKKIYNGVIENDRVFALLYYAPEEHLWDETGLYMSNPLRIEDNYEETRLLRQDAIDKPSEREEYLTKSMNHFVPSNSGEEYINIKDLQECKIDEFDWKGRDVWLGVDLAMTNDNVGVAMVTEEDGDIIGTAWGFIPSERIQIKSRLEDEDYRYYIQKGWCYDCGDYVVDYKYIEDFVLNIEEKYGVNVISLGYDRYNCLSSAQRWNSEGIESIEVRVHSSVLHPPTKLLKEKVLTKGFKYTENKLLEVNFANAKTVEDTNRNIYINKKKSKKKIDLVAAMINAIYLLQQDVIFSEESDWAIL